MLYGAKVKGRLEPITGTLGISQLGAIYEVRIDTQGILDENMAITRLLQLEANVPDLQILYIETNTQDSSIILQFTDAGPGQFGLETVLAWLPQLLLLAGIIAIAFTMFWVIPALQAIPQWVWYVVGIGGVLFVGAWLTGALKITPTTLAGTIATQKQAVVSAEKTAERTTEQEKRQLERLEAERHQKEEKMINKRQEVFDLVEQHEKVVREFDQCEAKEVPAEKLEQQVIKCRKKAETANVLQQKLNIALNEFNLLISGVGKTDTSIAERARVAEKIVRARSGVERLRRKGVDVSDLEQVVLID